MQPLLRQQRMTGSVFEETSRNFTQAEYQTRAVQEVMKNNFPDFMKRANFREIVIKGKIGGRDVEAHVRVCADVISVGTNTDYMRLSISAPEAQRLADNFGYVLPTEKLVEIIDAEAKRRGSFLPFRSAPEIARRVIDPQTNRPLSERWNANRPSGRWIMGPIFSNTHSRMTDEDVRSLNQNGDPIYIGHKKETVYHPHLVGHRLVAFYRPPLTPHKGWLPHDERYFDYSQSGRFIDPRISFVFTNSDGSKEKIDRDFKDVLQNNDNSGLYALISDYPMDITRMYRYESNSSVPVRTPQRGPKIILGDVNQ